MASSDTEVASELKTDLNNFFQKFKYDLPKEFPI